ncbi:hypothetical protein MMC09_006114 [Bachmanniomyces sp. S44760]|nr:hypothetical protein [Bachmanniomyces sp. S44760]
MTDSGLTTSLSRDGKESVTSEPPRLPRLPNSQIPRSRITVLVSGPSSGLRGLGIACHPNISRHAPERLPNTEICRLIYTRLGAMKKTGWYHAKRAMKEEPVYFNLWEKEREYEREWRNDFGLGGEDNEEDQEKMADDDDATSIDEHGLKETSVEAEQNTEKRSPPTQQRHSGKEPVMSESQKATFKKMARERYDKELAKLVSVPLKFSHYIQDLL